ncbi:MAG: HlyC/CorC family transporter [Bacteroidales bacterium]|nr:HlyC/CorC family transporter [Bacteroidales bacterium]
MMTFNISVLVSMLLLSAFFSGSEMAFLASNKLMIEINRSKSPRTTKIIDRFMANPSLLISTILVGNNITMVIFSLVFNDTMSPIIDRYSLGAMASLLIQTLISTVIIIVTAEFLPKNLIQLNASTMLRVLTPPLYFFYILFYPLGKFMQFLSSIILRIFFHQNETKVVASLVPGRVDFDNLVTTQAKQLDADSDVGQEARLMRGVLDFTKIKVRDCYVPRTDIVAVNIVDSVEVLQRKFVESGFSKILVYRGNIDNIIGYVHVSEMFKEVEHIGSVMSPIAIVPETMRANLLLKQFTSQHKSIAIVVDEFGGTAGLITLEDVLEEIFGEIHDEHDQEEYEERRIDEHTYAFEARIEVSYINEKYGLQLPVSDDYDTLGGLIIHNAQRIPQEGEEIEIAGVKYKITQASHSKVEKVVVTTN